MIDTAVIRRRSVDTSCLIEMAIPLTLLAFQTRSVPVGADATPGATGGNPPISAVVAVAAGAEHGSTEDGPSGKGSFPRG
jgi:hypothetical protein